MSRHGQNGEIARTESAYPIVVHCHLQWEWVWQRPQHTFSRLAQRHRVLFVETLPPQPDLKAPCLRRAHPQLDSLTVARVQFPLACWEDGDFVDRERRRLVQDLISGPLLGEFEAPVQWFYDPMAVTAFAGHLGERGIVYDCMDELSQFKGAPAGLLERERQLLSLADVVFAGGRKLHEAKRRQNPNCYFFGCGVEVEHFGRALKEETAMASELEAIPGPHLGYIGVVDERLDYELLATLADEREDWHIVMIGPVAKVDPASLPRRSNLHWLGAKDYQHLPKYLKGFDVCLMPFALNEATEYINPTKALEYLASGRPVVSTAVTDVVTNFPPVAVARSAAEFVEQCRVALETPSATRIQSGLHLARQHSWENIVEQMERHVETALLAKAGRQFRHDTHLELSHRGGCIPLPLPTSS